MKKETPMRDPLDDVKWIIGIMILLWFVWFFTGGPARQTSQGGAFIKPPSPLDSGETYGSLPSVNSSVSRLSELDLSFFKDQIFLRSISNGKEILPDKEYIEIKASGRNEKPVFISGWTLENARGIRLPISNASPLPYLSRVNQENPLFLDKDDSAYIVTGRSPIGVSFRVNYCSGYLEQFQDFAPPLKLACPSPLDGINTGALNLDQTCVDYINRIPRCTTNTSSLPSTLSPSCASFINSQINYNSCVDTHKNDSRFYQPEWRLFLKQTSEFWSNSKEAVRLMDHGGKLVDMMTY
ncbi:MAG: hypothetical protein HZC03_00550 [Candidatus Lloydbacteria bacterium]|nr:hypothetical protein [Candidatus Lloydbacteria bacterium]